MGRAKVETPARLAEKLKSVRLQLELTQEKMYEALVKEGVTLHSGYIGLYEIGERTPSLLVLLAYARVSEIPMERFVDDDLDIS